jgi:hypothetical protein
MLAIVAEVEVETSTLSYIEGVEFSPLLPTMPLDQTRISSSPH